MDLNKKRFRYYSYGLFLPLLFCLLVACYSNPQNDSATTKINSSITVDGHKRSYITHIPKEYDDNEPLPLVYILHGARSDAATIGRITQFHAQQSGKKFITVYPNADEKYWNDGRAKADPKINDVKFIEDLTDSLKKKYTINNKAVFAAGMSNGATMSVRLACQDSRIRAIATVASTAVKKVVENCKSQKPISAMFIKGTADPISDFKGVQKRKRNIAGYNYTVERFLDLSDCAPRPTENPIPDSTDDGTTVVRKQYHQCRDQSEVVSIIVKHGGHTWPGAPKNRSKLLVGKTSHDFSASKVIWAFFSRHVK